MESSLQLQIHSLYWLSIKHIVRQDKDIRSLRYQLNRFRSVSFLGFSDHRVASVVKSGLYQVVDINETNEEAYIKE